MSAWDEVDAWLQHHARDRKTLPHLSLVPTECAETGKTISSGALRTQQANLRIARGFHPFGTELRQPPGETCASCVHLRVKEFAKKFFKCGLGPNTNGPATDLRKKWPACAKWEAAP